jgi:hypothetical protein
MDGLKTTETALYINAFINPIGKNAFSRASINPRW